jgi:spore coat protein U-like protein
MAKNFVRFLVVLTTLIFNTSHAASNMMNVRIWVLSACRFETNGDLIKNFGNLNNADVTIKNVVPIHCTNGTNFRITLNQGLHANGQQRQMAQLNGSARLPYSLIASPEQGVGTGDRIDILLTGLVKKSDFQNRPVGNYADTVLLTIEP